MITGHVAETLGASAAHFSRTTLASFIKSSAE